MARESVLELADSLEVLEGSGAYWKLLRGKGCSVLRVRTLVSVSACVSTDSWERGASNVGAAVRSAYVRAGGYCHGFARQCCNFSTHVEVNHVATAVRELCGDAVLKGSGARTI